jgi:ribonuclease HI
LLGLKSELSQNYETQIKECKHTLQQDINNITNKNLYITESRKVINILFVPKILYKMNVVKFDKKNINLMNDILTKEAKKAIRCPTIYKKERFWKENKDGGMGLLNMETVNDKTLLSTFMNQGVNHKAKYPKRCIEHQIQECGLTLGTLKEMNTNKNNSYLSGIAQALQKMPFTITHKSTRETSKVEININTKKYYTLYDKKAGKRVEAVFTDGSYTASTGQAGAAVAFGLDNTMKWPAKYKTQSYGTELEGLEMALATSRAEIIFCDCLGAMTAVQEWNNKTNNQKGKDKNRGILRNMDRLIKERAEKGINRVELIWVPSHTEEDSKTITRKMEKQMKALQERFSMKAIRKGNAAVDESAKEGAELDGGLRILPQLCDNYVVLEEEEITERPLNGIIRQIYAKKFREKTENRSGWGELQMMDHSISNEIFTSERIEDRQIQTLAYQIRLNLLCLPQRQFCKFRTQKINDRITMIRSFKHPTPECEECNQKALCDLNHLWICPAYQDIMKELDEQILKTLNLIGIKSINKWYPSLKEDDISQLQFTRNDIHLESEPSSDSEGEDESSEEPPQKPEATKRPSETNTQDPQEWEQTIQEAYRKENNQPQQTIHTPFSNILEKHLGARTKSKTVAAQHKKKRYRTEPHLERSDTNCATHSSNKRVATEANNGRTSRDTEHWNQVERPKRGVKRRSLNEMLKEQCKKRRTETYPQQDLVESANIGKRKRLTLEGQVQGNGLRSGRVTAKERPLKKRKTIEELMNVKLLTIADVTEIQTEQLSTPEHPEVTSVENVTPRRRQSNSLV